MLLCLCLSENVFPGGSDSKASAYNAGDLGSIPGSNPWVGMISWRRKWQPTPVFLPGISWKSHGQRSLIGYSPWGCKESDTTERLHFHFPFIKVCQKMGLLGPGIDAFSFWIEDAQLHYQKIIAIHTHQQWLKASVFPQFSLGIIGF